MAVSILRSRIDLGCRLYIPFQFANEKAGQSPVLSFQHAYYILADVSANASSAEVEVKDLLSKKLLKASKSFLVFW